MNTQVLLILILSWLVGSVTAGLLIWYNARSRLVYAVFIGFGLLSGCAYDWAYGMGGSSIGWLMLVICPLLWLQGAWLVVRILPRWFAPAPSRSHPGLPASSTGNLRRSHGMRLRSLLGL